MAAMTGGRRKLVKGADGAGERPSIEAARELRRIEDLAPAPYNPRRIEPEALAALRRSLAEFGDISGLVWNRRTGHLVAGHQRLDALKREHGDALAVEWSDSASGEANDGQSARARAAAVVTPTGERFPVRIVDWDNAKEKAANIAANSPHLAGEYIADDLEAIMRELRLDENNLELLDGLRLGELVPALADLLAGDEATAAQRSESAAGGGEGQPAADGVEHLNFAVVLTAAQHETVTNAVRLAKQRSAGTTPAALAAICAHYKESFDE